MARTWLSVTVALLGGRGEDLWPWPGRVFAVGPSHTFLDLGNAIDDAFARWDRSHLSMFTLDDGRVVTDEDMGAELAASGFGPLIIPLDVAVTKVSRTVKLGAEFQYTFDLGDNWTHRCTVGTGKIDPMDEVGIVPAAPLPYWGWGSIPDQYGRRWADDDGEGPVPKRPGKPHPMLLHTWPAQELIPTVDLREVRGAIAAGDAGGFLAAVVGRDIDDVLQLVGAGIQMVLKQRRQDAEPLALSVVNRLISRGGTGDQVLADDLLAVLRGESLAGRVVPVDLDMLSAELEGDRESSIGGHIDLRTGDVYDDSAADPGMAGEDSAIDVEEDPDRWLRFGRTGSRDGWEDMSAFAERQRDERLRERMAHAIEGGGAFRRFRDLVHEVGLAEQWDVYTTDRQWGRARAFLADEGIRVG
jgi:hypothetical protein